MKKVCVILVLAALLILPTYASEGQAAKVKFNISMASLAVPISQGYDFSYDFYTRDETASWTESVANIGSRFSFDIGVGIFPIPELELYASYSDYGGIALGNYRLNIPHYAYYDEFLSADMADVESKFKASVFSFGFAFHPPMRGKIKPYLGVGMSSMSVKMDLLDEITIHDDLSFIYYEDALELWWVADEAIEITKIGYTRESQTVWAFHAKAGVNIGVAKNISVFIEGRYLGGIVEFNRPEVTVKTDIDYYYYEYDFGLEYEDTVSWTEEEKYDVDDKVEIKVGGVQAVVGIRIVF